MKKALITVAALLACLGCTRDRTSENPPIHINPNMDEQPKYKAQAESRFFADGSSMRQPVEGTVPRGWLRDNVVYYTGRNSDGALVREMPVPVTAELLQRGRERFDIFCSPCHSRVGDGQGMVVKKGLPPPPSFYEQRLRDAEDGYIFDVMTNGLRNMAAYKYQIPVADRWAIVAYFRELQQSRPAGRDDQPRDGRENIDEQRQSP
jgi:mono/diheme cytochrome c family protein